METALVVVLILIAFISFVLIPLYGIYDMFRVVLKFFFNDWWNQNLYFSSIDPLTREYLEKNFRYYQGLSPKDQRLFIKRVQKFLKHKQFEGREGLYISVEMEVLIAASATQLTFGHPSVYFRHFDRIIIYPDVYYSRLTDKYHRGEVNSKGVIVLSWKNFHEGYLNPNDGRNLGLHEMAHALRIVDFVDSEEHNFLDRKLFLRFVAYAREEMILIDNGGDSFFRKYAATNDHEFFAVAVENFFERPQEFYDYHPDLYNTVVSLLNQNPVYPSVLDNRRSG